MQEKKAMPSTVDEYIAQFPEDVQQLLQQVRQVIKETAPTATEKISYQIPCFYLNGLLVSFAGYTHHIGFYPRAEGVEAFKDELIGYKLSVGTVRLPLDKPIPYDLIRRIVRYRVAENL